MAKDLANVRIYGDTPSAVWVAPVGTPLPTDLTLELPSPWVEVGWISEDGLTQERAVESETFTAWQGGTIVRKRVTSTDNTFAFQALEETLTTYGLYYTGATAAAESNGLTRITVPAGTSVDERAYVLDFIDGEVHKRQIIERAEISDRGEVPHQNTELTVYEMTATIYGSFDVLTNNPAMAPAAAGPVLADEGA